MLVTHIAFIETSATLVYSRLFRTLKHFLFLLLVLLTVYFGVFIRLIDEIQILNYGDPYVLIIFTHIFLILLHWLIKISIYNIVTNLFFCMFSFHLLDVNTPHVLCAISRKCICRLNWIWNPGRVANCEYCGPHNALDTRARRDCYLHREWAAICNNNVHFCISDVYGYRNRCGKATTGAICRFRIMNMNLSNKIKYLYVWCRTCGNSAATV